MKFGHHWFYYFYYTTSWTTNWFKFWSQYGNHFELPIYIHVPQSPFFCPDWIISTTICWISLKFGSSFFSTLLTRHMVVYCQIIKLWSWGCFNIVFLLWSFGRFVGWKSESFLNPLLHLSHAEFLLVAMVTRWTKEGKVEKVEPSQTETWLIFVW